jgi:7,8-dihydropterin-6-yl-methyl-4-(beta-D-ribofuranosyl)aminobenzene 5'-phosphate synthase
MGTKSAPAAIYLVREARMHGPSIMAAWTVPEPLANPARVIWRNTMRRLWAAGAAIVTCLVLGGMPLSAQEASPASSADLTPTRLPALPPLQLSDFRLTVLYDNVSGGPEVRADWGFSALVEYGSNELLFDTGADGSLLLDNMQQLGVDPHSIEAVILSHQHSDHTGGLQDLLDTGARPAVYVPEQFSDSFKERVRDRTELVEVTDAVEVIPGVHTTRPTGVITEQALVVETGDGAVVVTGCAHPGAAEMVRQAQAVTSSRIAYLVGGLHLFMTPREKMPPLVAELRELGVDKILPAHCTGGNAIDLFRTAYGADFTEGGVGRTVDIPAE